MCFPVRIGILLQSKMLIKHKFDDEKERGWTLEKKRLGFRSLVPTLTCRSVWWSDRSVRRLRPGWRKCTPFPGWPTPGTRRPVPASPGCRSGRPGRPPPRSRPIPGCFDWWYPTPPWCEAFKIASTWNRLGPTPPSYCRTPLFCKKTVTDAGLNRPLCFLFLQLGSRMLSNHFSR